MSSREITECRVCGGRDFDDVIDLGVQPLANAFLTKDELHKPEPRFPLRAVRCTACQLVTLTVVVDAHVMFSRYVYATGNSSTMRDHFAAYASDIQRRYVKQGGLIVEVGSNDGTLLSAVDQSRARVLGVEPASNIAELARQKGVPTEVAFFGAESAQALASRHGPASAIIANNVIAHIDDLAGVMRGLDALLDADGVFVMEAPSLRALLEQRLFDTIYHEHLSYLSAHCLLRLAERHGLRVFDIAVTPVHGGSLRVFIDRGKREVSPSVDTELARERAYGIKEPATYGRFRDQVSESLRALPGALGMQRTWGYAAPAKGNTFLNAAGVTTEMMPVIVDKSPLKQGLFTPGTHIPVQSPDRLHDPDSPQALCILAWNIANEIRAEQNAFRGKFLVPLPLPRFME